MHSWGFALREVVFYKSRKPHSLKILLWCDYLGTKTGEKILHSQTVAFSECTSAPTIPPTSYTNGITYLITYYCLLEGRGWILEFDTEVPGHKTLTVFPRSMGILSSAAPGF